MAHAFKILHINLHRNCIFRCIYIHPNYQKWVIVGKLNWIWECGNHWNIKSDVHYFCQQALSGTFFFIFFSLHTPLHHPFFLTENLLLIIVYTFPSKVSWIVNSRRQGQSLNEIANSIGIHCTTVFWILKRFKQSGNNYHINLKTGRPHKMEIWECQIAAWMLSQVKAANATKVQKKAFPQVSVHMIRRHLKKQGLLCRVRKSKPFIFSANKEKRRLWTMQHAS